MSSSTVCCIGAGYVGGPTCAVMAWKCPELKVYIVDVNKQRIDDWNSDVLPIYEPEIDHIVKSCRGRNLFFSTNIDAAIMESDIIFISVNTPTKSSGVGVGCATDLSFFEMATKRIATVANTPKIVVEKSTVPCRTAELVQNILYKFSANKIHFDILSNPEFLAEGSAVHDLLHPDRILIGSFQNEAGKAAEKKLIDIYMRWVPREKILTMNLWSSELSKLASNALLAQRISSINSLSTICEVIGADIDDVSRAVGADIRIGDKFLKAGIGFGGSCFKKDVLNLVYICESLKLYDVSDYWKQVITINEYQKLRFTEKIISLMFSTFENRNITIWGVAFKKNTSDTRESPAITIIQHLLLENAMIHIYDPKVTAKQIRSDLANLGIESLGMTNVIIHQNPYDACIDSSSIIICTDWDIFKTLDYRKIYQLMRKPAYIFDGKLMLNSKMLKVLGFCVEQIGKPSHVDLSV